MSVARCDSISVNPIRVISIVLYAGGVSTVVSLFWGFFNLCWLSARERRLLFVLVSVRESRVVECLLCTFAHKSIKCAILHFVWLWVVVPVFVVLSH